MENKVGHHKEITLAHIEQAIRGRSISAQVVDFVGDLINVGGTPTRALPARQVYDLWGGTGRLAS